MRACALLSLLLTALGAPAFAGVMDGLDSLPAGFAPRLEKIVAAKPAHFVKHGDGCPAATDACTEKAYLVPGDLVIVLGTQGDDVEVIFTGGAPRFRSTRGWLPRSALAPVPAAATPAWVGRWANGDDFIAITPAPGGSLAFVGSASWGGGDPARVANGGVNVGAFDTTLAPRGASVTFSPSADDGKPATLDPKVDSDDCVLRLWLLDPYLVAADNGKCGGMNVTFSNVYRRAPAKP